MLVGIELVRTGRLELAPMLAHRFGVAAGTRDGSIQVIVTPDPTED